MWHTNTKLLCSHSSICMEMTISIWILQMLSCKFRCRQRACIISHSMYCTVKNLVHCVCVGVPLSNCTHLSVCYETQISHVTHLIFLSAWKEYYEYGLFKITTSSWKQCSLVCECQNPGIVYANTGLQEKKYENCLKSVFMSFLKSQTVLEVQPFFTCLNYNSINVIMAPGSTAGTKGPVLFPILLWLLFWFVR